MCYECVIRKVDSSLVMENLMRNACQNFGFPSADRSQSLLQKAETA